MKFLIQDDLVIGTGEGDIVGIDVGAFAGVDLAALRYDGKKLIDVSGRTSWYVDLAGVRHINPANGRTLVTCAHTDEIEPTGDGGWRVIDQLARLKEHRKAAIDVEAERQRQRWITPGAGQAMTYARKVEQANAVLADEDPQPEDYPMLAASIGIDGADIVAVANAVIAMDAAWEQIGAAIEQARLGGKQAVELAEDIAAVEALTVIWPEP